MNHLTRNTTHKLRDITVEPQPMATFGSSITLQTEMNAP